jgi:hypothetical protein
MSEMGIALSKDVDSTIYEVSVKKVYDTIHGVGKLVCGLSTLQRWKKRFKSLPDKAEPTSVPPTIPRALEIFITITNQNNSLKVEQWKPVEASRNLRTS